MNSASAWGQTNPFTESVSDRWSNVRFQSAPTQTLVSYIRCVIKLRWRIRTLMIRVWCPETIINPCNKPSSSWSIDRKPFREDGTCVHYEDARTFLVSSCRCWCITTRDVLQNYTWFLLWLPIFLFPHTFVVYYQLPFNVRRDLSMPLHAWWNHIVVSLCSSG